MKSKFHIRILLSAMVLFAPVGVRGEVTAESLPFSLRQSLEDCTFYEQGNRSETLSLMAELGKKAKKDGKWLSLGRIMDLGEGHLVINYTLAAREMEEFTEDWVGPDETCWVSYDCATEEILGEYVDKHGTDGWMDVMGDGLLYTQYTEEGRVLTLMDAELTPVSSFSLGNSETEDLMPGDFGEFYYTGEEKQLIRRSLRTDGTFQEEEIAIRPYFLLERVEGYVREQGRSYLILAGRGGDLKQMRGYLDLSTGEFVRAEYADDMYGYVSEGTLFWTRYGWNSENANSSILLSREEGSWETDWEGEDPPECHVLSDGRVLFQRTTYHWAEEAAAPESEETEPPETEVQVFGGGEGAASITAEPLPAEEEEEVDPGYYGEERGPDLDYATLEYWLMDAESGRITGTLRIDGDPGEYLYDWGNPVVLEENGAIALHIDGEGGSTRFYRWEPFLSTEVTEIPVIRDYAWKQAEALELSTDWDPEQFAPGAVPENLTDLKERADCLAAQYGFEIKISKACSGICGGYAIIAENDWNTIENAISVMEKELKKYPENFFRDLHSEYVGPIVFYLAGELVGVDEGVLSTAGGFCNWNGEVSLIAMDIRSGADLASTIHHEISHVIEGVVMMESYDNPLYGEAWDALNPQLSEESVYTYSYESYEDGGDDRWVYQWDNAAEAYFIDRYSRINPEEDRARLFENAMIDDDFSWIPWEDAPHLRAKLNAYALAMRQVFGSDSWDGVRWERFSQ